MALKKIRSVNMLKRGHWNAGRNSKLVSYKLMAAWFKRKLMAGAKREQQESIFVLHNAHQRRWQKAFRRDEGVWLKESAITTLRRHLRQPQVKCTILRIGTIKNAVIMLSVICMRSEAMVTASNSLFRNVWAVRKYFFRFNFCSARPLLTNETFVFNSRIAKLSELQTICTPAYFMPYSLIYF